ncbi:HIT domain-containing protein [Candidatus Dojkabacteria bacterium]|nr:HIT domain-containing protein [Candidatus Dojkabacteria bacterium]
MAGNSNLLTDNHYFYQQQKLPRELSEGSLQKSSKNMSKKNSPQLKKGLKNQKMSDDKAQDRFEQSQYTFSDLLQVKARSGGAKYWYGKIWKSVGKCVFCDLKKRYTIMELDGMVLTVNIYPYIDGNLIIVPKRHITHIKELTEKEWAVVKKLHYVAKKMLRKIFGYKGLWMIYREGSSYETSQKTVEHMHIHLMPYAENLVTWNYQPLKLPPFETAAIFRENKKAVDTLLRRYEEKYEKDS